MIYYNLYSKGELINKTPLTEEQVKEVFSDSTRKIYKKEKFTNKKVEIKLKSIQIVPCILI